MNVWRLGAGVFAGMIACAGAAACESTGGNGGATSSAEETSASGTGSGDAAPTESVSGPSSASTMGSGGTPDTTGLEDVAPECQAFCSACLPEGLEACLDSCASTHEMFVSDSGEGCGESWLRWRNCVAEDPACDVAADTAGPCRFYARNHLALCGGPITGDCGRHPDQGDGEFDECGARSSNAGSCPTDVMVANVGAGSDQCGSLPLFEGCCSASGDYFYCDPQGSGLTYDECPAA